MSQKTEICLILNDIRSTHNVGSIFRTAECFGISHIYICGYTPAPNFEGDGRLPHLANKLHKQIDKTALGATGLVPFSVISDYESLVADLQSHGYIIAALEQSKKSQKLDAYLPPPKIALVLGNELNGIDDWTLSISNVILEIEQYGAKESLNVANASAIAMHTIKEKQIAQYGPSA